MTNKQAIAFLLFISGICTYAQNKQLLYNFTEIPQSLMVNPGATIQNRGYFGIPVLSGIYVNAGSSNMSVYDLFADNGVDFNTKVNNMVYSLKAGDVQRVNQQLEVLNIGFKIGGHFGKSYITFGAYQEIDFFNYWPKDLAILAYEGNAPNIGRAFNLSHLNVKGELLTVYHAGYHKMVSDRFSYGVRGKIYSSIIDFTSTKNSGTFITTEGENNFYRHALVSNVEVKTSGYASLREDDVNGGRDVVNKMMPRAFLAGNLGLGIDFGITYSPNETWTYTASIQDLGFIYHNKDVERYTLKGQDAIEGIELPFDDIFNDTGLSNNWQELVDEIEEAFPRDTIRDPYTTMRPVKLNAAAIYNFGGYAGKNACDCTASGFDGLINSVGLQLFAEKRPKYPEVALTAFYYRRLAQALRIKATYTVDKFSKKNIGLGLSTHFANFNFYLLADNLLEYYNLAKANNASIQLGFNYMFPMRN
ncbi:DUF5723 family protein [Galbibacter sp. PAP.153]|uniref:DUF5723 family protein n=1 Tax=Galbibacter sp. PAP.153 TaxID=3104623 RepID=UPI00300AB6B1